MTILAKVAFIALLEPSGGPISKNRILLLLRLPFGPPVTFIILIDISKNRRQAATAVLTGPSLSWSTNVLFFFFMIDRKKTASSCETVELSEKIVTSTHHTTIRDPLYIQPVGGQPARAKYSSDLSIKLRLLSESACKMTACIINSILISCLCVERETMGGSSVIGDQ